MKLRQRAFGLLALLALTAGLLGGCKVLGVRSIPFYELRDKYEGPGSNYLEVDGTRVHYRIEGKKGAPTLVLLHGVLASLHTWDGWVKRLREHYQIVRLDLPGFGLTGPMASDDYTPEYAMKFFEMFRAKLAGEHPEVNLEKFLLAGNSLGGFISWYYAVHYPERVEKLIIIDPIAYPQDLPFIINFASKPFWGFFATHQSPRFIIKRNIRKVYGDSDRVTDETIDRYHDLLLREGNRESMVKYFRTLKKYSTNEEICKAIPRIKAPTFLMHGEVDRWVPPELVERWRQDLPGVKIKLYETAGHIPMEELPDETVVDAYAFLSGGGTLKLGYDAESPPPSLEAPEEEPAKAPDWESGQEVAPEEPPPPHEQGEEPPPPKKPPAIKRNEEKKNEEKKEVPVESLPVAAPEMPEW
jgi:pimeloyl-ACP methyl ester carboxylesterase